MAVLVLPATGTAPPAVSFVRRACCPEPEARVLGWQPISTRRRRSLPPYGCASFFTRETGRGRVTGCVRHDWLLPAHERSALTGDT